MDQNGAGALVLAAVGLAIVTIAVALDLHAFGGAVLRATGFTFVVAALIEESYDS